MYALKSNAWDLGNYNQAIYTFVCCNQPFSWTSDILNNGSGSLFGIHFSPIFFALVPFYVLFPRAETLLVIQSIALGIGAIPLYWITRDRLSSRRWGLILAVSYLCNPLVMGVNWFDFHPEAFIPATVLMMIHFWSRKRWKLFACASLLALSTIESTVFPVGLLAVYFAYSSMRSRKPNLLRSLTPSISLLVVSILWGVLAYSTIHLFNPVYQSSTYFSVLGANSVNDVPRAIISSPAGAIQALRFGLPDKLVFLLIVFGSLGFVSLLAPTAMVPALAWLVPALLSNNPAYYMVGLNYPAFILPFLAWSAVEGLRNLRVLIGRYPVVRLYGHFLLTFPTSFRNHKKVFFGFPVVFLLMTNPVLSLGIDTVSWVHYGFPSQNHHTQVAVQLLNLVPKDASVLTEDHLFPLISSRPNAYTIPWAINNNTGPFFAYVYELVNKVDYIALDLTNGETGRTEAVLGMTQDFGVLGYSDSVLLLERAYSGSPAIFQPLVTSYNFQQLTLRNGSIVFDPASTSGRVLANVGNLPVNTDFWWGPYVQLPPGKYEITFWLRSGANCTGKPIVLTISAFELLVEALAPEDPAYASDITVVPRSTGVRNILAQMPVDCSSLNTTGYAPETITTSLDLYGTYEFAGRNVSSTVPLFLDKVEIHELTPLSNVQPFLIRLKSGEPIIYSRPYVSNILRVASLVPPSDFLLEQSSFGLLVSHTGPTNQTPIVGKMNSTEYHSHLDPAISKANYVLIDTLLNVTESNYLMSDPTLRNNFGMLAWSGGIMLLERGYTGPIVELNATNLLENYQSFVNRPGSMVVPDPLSSSGFALRNNGTVGGDLWWGPYLSLAPGNYSVDFDLRLAQPTMGKILTLQVNYFSVSGNKSTLESMTVSGSDFNSTKGYVQFSTTFFAGRAGTYEFPGVMIATTSTIYVDQVHVQLQNPSLYAVTP